MTYGQSVALKDLLAQFEQWRSAEEKQKRKVRRDEWREEWARRQAEEQALLSGQDPNLFATTSKIHEPGHRSMEPAYSLISAKYRFDAMFELRSADRKDRSTLGRRAPRQRLILPHDAEIFVGDAVFDIEGASLGLVVSIDTVGRGEILHKLSLRDGCGEERTTNVTGLARLEVQLGNSLVPRSHTGPGPAVLLIAAFSSEHPVNIGAERRMLEDRFGSGAVRCVINATASDLVLEVQKHRPDVIHFAGHSDRTGISLEDNLGQELAVTTDDFAAFLQGRSVALLMLSSCFSTEVGESCLAHVGAVVGTTDLVDDDEAAAFSQDFYRALAEGRTVGEAERAARDAMVMSGKDEDLFRLSGDPDIRIDSLLRSAPPNGFGRTQVAESTSSPE